jgi:P-type Cu+ transporter
LAGSLEEQSEHPLAQAISFYAQREGAAFSQVTDFRTVPGKGVIGNWNGAQAALGRPSFIQERGMQLTPEAQNAIDELAAQGKTAVVVARGHDIAGLLGLQDIPRASAKSLMRRLRAKGIRTAMLTGDSPAVAKAIGKELGLDEIHAELLPDQKVGVIERLQQEGRKVAMVGDGINDAPALAQANVGIAIGAGTDVAIESAGVILIGDKLDDVANALTLGKASYRTLTVNVGVAVAFNIGGMTMAALGWITPLLAIGIMILSIFAILVSTMRIRALQFGREESFPTGHLAELEFSVPNMVCEGCAEKITSVLEPMNGIREVRPKLSLKQVYIRYEPALLTEQAVQQALTQEGFTAIKT